MGADVRPSPAPASCAFPRPPALPPCPVADGCRPASRPASPPLGPGFPRACLPPDSPGVVPHLPVGRTVLVPQVAEGQGRRLVGQRTRPSRAHEAPHRLHLVAQGLRVGLAEVVGQVHAVHGHRHPKRVRPATAPGFGMGRLDPLLRPVPRNQPDHRVEERLAPRPTRLQVVLQFREARLFHRSHTMRWPYRQSCQDRLAQVFLGDCYRLYCEVVGSDCKYPYNLR